MREKMYDADERYSKKYVERIEEKTWRASAITRASVIMYSYFKPESIVDFGAANGFYLCQPKKFGCEVLGVEGTRSWFRPMARRIGPDNCLIYDMRKSLNLGRKFDLVISIEMLEHLEKMYAKIAVESIVRHAKETLLITASPHKGGFYHENPQKKEYWIRLFEDAGVEYDPAETELLQMIFGSVPNLRWLREDLMIFRTVDKI